METRGSLSELEHSKEDQRHVGKEEEEEAAATAAERQTQAVCEDEEPSRLEL